MLEDGYETDVVLRSNLVLSLLPPKVMPNLSPHPRDDTDSDKKCNICEAATSPPQPCTPNHFPAPEHRYPVCSAIGTEDDYTPSGFWVSHPSVYLIGNAG